jgi:hypothetical protein
VNGFFDKPGIDKADWNNIALALSDAMNPDDMNVLDNFRYRPGATPSDKNIFRIQEARRLRALNPEASRTW